MYQKYKNGEISALQSYIMIISIMIGSGILGLSRSVAEVSKQDGWISVFINGLFIAAIMAMIIYTPSKFPQKNFIEYTRFLLGKPLSYVVSLGYVVYALLVTATVIRYLSEMTRTWLLPNTPLYIINLLILLTAVYMIKNGLTTLARFNEVIALMLIPFALLILVGLPEASLTNLRPIGGTGIMTILRGIVPSFFSFAGYEVLLIIYPYISNKQEPVMKYSILSVIMVTLFYTATVASQIALYGPDELIHVLYPSINYLTAVDFPVIERMEIFFTIFWALTVLGTIGIQYLAGSIVLQNIFSKRKTRFFTYFLFPIIYFITLYPQSTAEVVEFGEKVGSANIFFGLLLPILLFFLYFIKGRGSRNE